MYAYPISGIYKILNTINGKIYIGSSSDIFGRWTSHKSLLNRNKHSSIHLQNAWNIYGQEVFKFEIIEQIDQHKLIEREQYWIDYYNSSNDQFGYNMLQKAQSSFGYRHTDETKLSISKKMTDRKLSDTTIQKFKSRDYSYLRTPEIIAKSVKSKKGQTRSDETKLKQSIALKLAYVEGRKHAWSTGIPMSEIVKDKIRNALKGRKLSDRRKQNLRKPHKKHERN